MELLTCRGEWGQIVETERSMAQIKRIWPKPERSVAQLEYRAERANTSVPLDDDDVSQGRAASEGVFRLRARPCFGQKARSSNQVAYKSGIELAVTIARSPPPAIVLSCALISTARSTAVWNGVTLDETVSRTASKLSTADYFSPT
jgi:hypothetical protein